jgi:hypothetical protein
MFMASFFTWWYGTGWRQVLSSFMPRLKAIAQTFSVSQLINTLFAPWRRIITYPGASLPERFHAWGDNLFSRTIGFVVRLFVLLAALIASLITALVSLIEIIIWPLMPPAVIGLIIAGLIR